MITAVLETSRQSALTAVRIARSASQSTTTALGRLEHVLSSTDDSVGGLVNAARSSGHFFRSTSPADFSERARPAHSQEPDASEILPGFDQLSLEEILAVVPKLDPASIQTLLDYERSHGFRSSIVELLRNALSSSSYLHDTDDQYGG